MKYFTCTLIKLNRPLHCYFVSIQIILLRILPEVIFLTKTLYNKINIKKLTRNQICIPIDVSKT